MKLKKEINQKRVADRNSFLMLLLLGFPLGRDKLLAHENMDIKKASV